MRYLDSYSRWVAIFKVLLPLAALGILSTLFLLSKSSDPNATIPFSDAEIAERIRDQQITAPRFAGTTERGDEVFVSATKAVPGGGDNPGQAEDLRAQIKLAAGGVVTLRAERGWVNVPDDAASFRGRVTIETDTGYRLVTDWLDSAVKRIDMRAPGAVTGTGPLGRLTAGAMHITAPNNDADATHLVFTDGVNLLYDPQQTER